MARDPFAAGSGAALDSLEADSSSELSFLSDGGQNGRPGAVLVENTQSVPHLFMRLVHDYIDHKSFVVLALIVSLISTGFELWIPIQIGHAIDLFVGPNSVDFTRLGTILRTIIFAAVLVGIGAWLRSYLINTIAYHCTAKLKDASFKKVQKLELSLLDRLPVGELMARIGADSERVGDGLLQGLTQLFGGLAQIVFTIFFMLSQSRYMAFVVILLTPLSLLVAWLLARFGSTSFNEQQKFQGKLSAYSEEMITNQKLNFVFEQHNTNCQRFDVINDELYTVGERAQFVSSLANPGTRFINNIIYAIVAMFGFGAALTSKPSALSIGQVQSFLVYANQYTKPFNEITGVLSEIQAAISSARRIVGLLDAPEIIEKTSATEEMSATEEKLIADCSISFDQVSFSYVADKPVIKELSLDIAPGMNVAFVGPTGCGKTTLLNLLLRFYPLDSGSIKLNGTDISAVTRSELRSHFGMVLQDSWISSDTIHNCIAFGKPTASREEVVKAAQKAHAHRFIEALPKGYDTVLGENGQPLSQGQLQLLSIARVMLIDPEILILDEATSSIDTHTERQVQAAFDEMCQGRTALIVAHRLSTIKGADLICVMKDGAIIESGTHEDLVKQNGFYSELLSSQFAGIAI